MRLPHRHLAALFLLGLVSLLSGCASIGMYPVTVEMRHVSPTADENMIVTVLKRSTYYDTHSKTYRVTIPSGIYRLEAEDDSYWYFYNPSLMMRETFDGDQNVSREMFSGGLMIGKKKGMLVPAGIYKSDGSLRPYLIWKFNRKFSKSEGSVWTRSGFPQDEAAK